MQVIDLGNVGFYLRTHSIPIIDSRNGGCILNQIHRILLLMNESTGLCMINESFSTVPQDANPNPNIIIFV